MKEGIREAEKWGKERIGSVRIKKEIGEKREAEQFPDDRTVREQGNTIQIYLNSTL